MAKLAKKKVEGISKYTTKKTVNKTGAAAYELNDEAKLVTAVLTSFFNEPKYYGDTSKDIINTARKLSESDPVFVAKLASYARKEFHMRTISQVLAAEVAHKAKGNPIVRKMIRKVIERPDDMTNMLSYYLDQYEKPITCGLRRGIADCFLKFDEYQLAKYKCLDKDVKLRDALLISHPKPSNDEQSAMWKRLIENTLKIPKTRETILSKHGQSKKVWEDFIDSGKMGYMAMLRNLKNMLDNKVSQAHIEIVCERLRNPVAVRKSKQLPFRFYSAYKMVSKSYSSVIAHKVLDALEDALTISFENIPELPGTTAIITDESGSMTWNNVSGNSNIRMIDIGNLLGAAASKFSDNGVVIPFGATAKVVHFGKHSSIFDNMSKLEHSGVGHATFLNTALDCIDRLDAPVDRILLFSDMQCYGRGHAQTWINKYRQQKNSNLWFHSIDLSGYGTAKCTGNNVNLIAGWSDKVLSFIKITEEAGSDLIDIIRNYNL